MSTIINNNVLNSRFLLNEWIIAALATGGKMSETMGMLICATVVTILLYSMYVSYNIMLYTLNIQKQIYF
jgi:hypothetical protein